MVNPVPETSVALPESKNVIGPEPDSLTSEHLHLSCPVEKVTTTLAVAPTKPVIDANIVFIASVI